MAISKDDISKMISTWRKGNKVDKLSDSYLEYLDDYLQSKGIDTFAKDPDTGEELDDYTPEFESAQADVLKDLGLSDLEIGMIMNDEWPNPNVVWPGTDQKVWSESGITKRPDNKTPADKVPDDPDESSEKPHDKELAGEKTPEEDFMERAAAGEVPATSGVLAGDLTPEEIEMIQMMRAGKQPPKSKELAGETTPEEKEMLNITNRLAKNLSKHRW